LRDWFWGALKWLEAQSRWSKLRALGQSNMVRASVLMPVFGYLLLLNENVRQYLTIRFDVVPSMWRVWLLYYGSFALAIGSILFTFWCPAYIKKYASAFQMADAERHHRTAQNQTGQIAQELSALYTRMSKRENSIFDLPKLQPDQPNMGIGSPTGLSSSDQWGLGLIHIWSVSDIKYPRWRFLTLVLFSAGIIALAVPAGWTFVQVTYHLALRLF
jgi:hypothetical protein